MSAPDGGASRGATADGEAHRWWTLVAVCGATFMLLVDITIVQVALPTIQRDLHASFSDLEWVISAYALALSALILTSGSLADRFGRKRIFVAGLAVFTVASLLCGLATDPTFLIASRAVQGIGGAAMFATSLALIGQDYHGRQRATAIALWGATVGGAVAVGPLIGGALTSAFGWQWIFFVNLPIGAGTIVLALLRIANRRDPGAKRLDVAGLVTFSTALFFLVFGLTRGNDDGWSSTTVLVSLALAAVLLCVFVAAELVQRRPMFDLSLFKSPSFTGVSVATLAIGAGLFAMFPYVTFYLQNDLGLSPFQGGLRMLPMTVLAFAVPLFTRNLADRLPPGLVLAGGMLLCAGGLALMVGLTTSSNWTALLAGLVVGGLGIGIANPAIARAALGVVDPQRTGMASGINNTFRIAGLACGVAGIGAVFQSRIGASLAKSLHHPAPGLAKAVASAGPRAAAHGQAHVVAASRVAFVSSMNVILVVGAIVVLIGVGAAALVRSRGFHATPSGPAGSTEAERDVAVEALA